MKLYIVTLSENKLKTEQMEVVKTDSGWKRTKYGNLSNFDNLDCWS